MVSSMVALIEVAVYVGIFLFIIRRIKKRRHEAVDARKMPPEPTFTSGQMDYTKDIENPLKGVTVAVNGKPHTITTEAPYPEKSGAADAEEEPQISTTDYLAEKARQDQLEHAREKREEIRRLSQKSGGLLPAERLYDGDPVPNGKHCVICGYCGAENLIPNGSARKHSCYFCREPI